MEKGRLISLTKGAILELVTEEGKTEDKSKPEDTSTIEFEVPDDMEAGKFERELSSSTKNEEWNKMWQKWRPPSTYCCEEGGEATG